MATVDSTARRLTKAFIHLDHLTHNFRLLQRQVGSAQVWPVLKANGYGHDAAIVASHLLRLGCQTLCVADIEEAIALADKGVDAKFCILSATLPQHSEALVAYNCQPVVCTLEMVEALARAAMKSAKRLPVHVKIDTGMGRVGIRLEEVVRFLDRCRNFPALEVRGLMSHFPRADEADQSHSVAQLDRFRQAVGLTKDRFALSIPSRVRGKRCPQVGRITMDMSLIDVTALRGQVQLGDEAVIIGSQGAAAISADELASKLGTINYEIVTAISHRVPRVAVETEA